MAKKKQIDQNGFATYRECEFFCECVAQYLGSEIDCDGSLGLNPKGIYNVYRPKSEIAKKEFVESLNAKPVLDDHHIIGNIDGLKNPDKQRTDGVLTEVKLVGNKLVGRIDVWSPDMINKIDSGKKELSLSYAADFIPKKGIAPSGEHYDFVQSNLRCGNHLALVDEARNGHDCRIQDGAFVRDEIIKLENLEMDISKLSADELVEGLKGCSDEVKAKVKDFLNTPTEAEKKAAEEKQKADEAAKKAEMDAAVETAKKEATEAAEKKAADEAKVVAENAEKDKQKACDAAIAEYKKVLQLAEDAKPAFGVINCDGIKTEQELAVKICALESAPKFLKDSKPEGAIAALRGFIAGRGAVQKTTTIVGDTRTTKKSFSEYMATR